MPGRPGAVVLAGDRLALPAGRDARAPRRLIDAAGHVVAPGFIDLHSHGGLVMLAEPRHEPKVRQGVTTELIGVDGKPTRRSPREDLRFVASMPASTGGRVALDWWSVAAHLERFDGAPR